MKRSVNECENIYVKTGKEKPNMDRSQQTLGSHKRLVIRLSLFSVWRFYATFVSCNFHVRHCVAPVKSCVVEQ